MMRPVRLPWRGAGNKAAFIAQRGDLAPPSEIANVEIHDPGTGREGISQRRGLVKRFSRQLADAAGQAVLSIRRASVQTGYTVPRARPDDTPPYSPCSHVVTADNRPTSALAGNLFFLDRVPSMERAVLADVVSLHGADAAGSCVSVAFHAGGARLAAAYNYTVGGTQQTRVEIRDYATGAVLGAYATTDVAGYSTNTVVWSQSYLFACINGSVYVFNGTTCALLEVRTMHGWASEAVEAVVWDNGEQEFLYVAFNGSWAGGSTTGHTITGGYPARHFRSGIMKFRINAANPYLTRLTFGQQLAAGHPFYEADHLSWRISEQSALAPHGAEITAMRLGPNGELVVGRTNRGYGPNAAYPPHTQIPPVSFFVVESDGSLRYETDHGSIVEGGLDGFQNDIPYAGDSTPDPSVSAVEIDADGDIYLGGRTNGAGYSLFKRAGGSGAALWGIDLQGASGTVRQAGLRLDRSDGSILVAGDENTSWEGASGKHAHLWRVTRTGEIAAWWTLTDQVAAPAACGKSALCVAANQFGAIAYGSDPL